MLRVPLTILEAKTSVPNHSWHLPHGWQQVTFLSILGSLVGPAARCPAGFPFHTQRSSMPCVSMERSLSALLISL